MTFWVQSLKRKGDKKWCAKEVLNGGSNGIVTTMISRLAVHNLKPRVWKTGLLFCGSDFSCWPSTIGRTDSLKGQRVSDGRCERYHPVWAKMFPESSLETRLNIMCCRCFPLCHIFVHNENNRNAITPMVWSHRWEVREEVWQVRMNSLEWKQQQLSTKNVSVGAGGQSLR